MASSAFTWLLKKIAEGQRKREAKMRFKSLSEFDFLLLMAKKLVGVDKERIREGGRCRTMVSIYNSRPSRLGLTPLIPPKLYRKSC